METGSIVEAKLFAPEVMLVFLLQLLDQITHFELPVITIHLSVLFVDRTDWNPLLLILLGLVRLLSHRNVRMILLR